jgi:hypothetical protein
MTLTASISSVLSFALARNPARPPLANDRTDHKAQRENQDGQIGIAFMQPVHGGPFRMLRKPEVENKDIPFILGQPTPQWLPCRKTSLLPASSILPRLHEGSNDLQLIGPGP